MKADRKKKAPPLEVVVEFRRAQLRAGLSTSALHQAIAREHVSTTRGHLADVYDGTVLPRVEVAAAIWRVLGAPLPEAWRGVS